MSDPKTMKMIQAMLAKRQSPDGVVPESDDSTDFAVESPDQEYDLPEDIQQGTAKLGRSSDAMSAGMPGNSYGSTDEMKALLSKLQGSQPSTEEVEVAPESIDMKKAALEKIKQKYLGR